MRMIQEGGGLEKAYKPLFEPYFPLSSLNLAQVFLDANETNYGLTIMLRIFSQED